MKDECDSRQTLAFFVKLGFVPLLVIGPGDTSFVSPPRESQHKLNSLGRIYVELRDEFQKQTKLEIKYILIRTDGSRDPKSGFDVDLEIVQFWGS